LKLIGAMHHDSASAGNVACAECGQTFRCGFRAGDAHCWCAELPRRLPMPADPAAGCLCAACLQRRLDDVPGKSGTAEPA
jgi:hypothetical protein